MNQTRHRPTVFASLFVLASLVSPLQNAGADGNPRPVYSVAEYDPARDPAEDLKVTVAKARKENKRILLQVGGEWCSWCHLMNDYFHGNEKVAAALQNGFIIMKVNFSPENKNERFLKQYPKVSGYPYIFVLESDGKLLHPQDTAELEKGRGYSEEAMLGFLRKWAPKPADASSQK